MTIVVKTVSYFFKEFQMKKRVLAYFFCIILFLMMTLSSCMTIKPIKQPMSKYSSIIEVISTTKDELWLKANAWCVDSFRNSKSVIQYSDKEAGIIQGKFSSKHNGYFYQYVQTTFSIELKDNKARITFYDPLRIILGDIMFGIYSSTKEVPVYKSDAKLMERVLADWLSLENTFRYTLKHNKNDNW